MLSQILFIAILLLSVGGLGFSMARIFQFFGFTQAFPLGNWKERVSVTFRVALGQSKMFRFLGMGLAHALVFWGFLVITLGSMEMILDGITGHHRIMAFTGWFYDFVMASGDVFAMVVLLAILVFLARRLFLHIPRFKGTEMKPVSKWDANLALAFILLLMISLLGMNVFYLLLAGNEAVGLYPVSRILSGLFTETGYSGLVFYHELFWWMHILLIFAFANFLPYSKHFHVFMSVPNVFLSRLEPLGQMANMPHIQREVALMMDPGLESVAEPTAAPARFGVKDVEDLTWKNYLDSLSCTECGRCTSVCPANITGKQLSPRKIIMDIRARMREKGPGMAKNGREFSDNRSLLRDFISEEELWACTTCNACAQECPININQPAVILDMRRYLVMEESAAPAGLNAIFQTIENNGAPWQFSAQDRLKWAENTPL